MTAMLSVLKSARATLILNPQYFMCHCRAIKEASWQKCAETEKARLRAIKSYKDRFVPRKYKCREEPRQRTPTTLDAVVGRLDAAIKRAAVHQPP